MSYYVYILTNKTNSVIYTGVTNNLLRRLYEHKEGLNPKSFTSRYKIYKLVYCEEYGEAELAIQREKQIKSWNRERKNKLIESTNPNWDELYNE